MKLKQSYGVSAARWELSEILERVQGQGERVTLTRHNVPVAVIVPIADADKLDKERASRVRGDSKAVK